MDPQIHKSQVSSPSQGMKVDYHPDANAPITSERFKKYFNQKYNEFWERRGMHPPDYWELGFGKEAKDRRPSPQRLK